MLKKFSQSLKTRIPERFQILYLTMFQCKVVGRMAVEIRQIRDGFNPISFDWPFGGAR